MKAVYSSEEDFLVQGVWQGHILLLFPLPFNYQPPIMAVPKGKNNRLKALGILLSERKTHLAKRSEFVMEYENISQQTKIWQMNDFICQIFL